MPSSGFPLLFLQASLSALATCGAAWALLRLARRRWPSLDARRTPWLLAQLAGAVTLVLALLPAASRLSMFAGQAPGAAGLAQPLTGDGVFLATHASEMATGFLLPAVAWLWLFAYTAGAASHAVRWHRVRRDLRALLRAADRLDGPALQAHPAFYRQRGALLRVLELDAPVSPMLAGLLHPVLLLPRAMRGLPAAQQQLIVAHELMHLHRRDHLWHHAATLLLVLLWFVPPVHGFYARLRWALETGCDRAVLAGRSHGERRNYAAALLAQLAVQVQAGGGAMAPAPLAFGLGGAQAVADRIHLIRDSQPAARVPFASTLALLLLPALCGASVVLQPQFAWHEAADTAPAAPAWQAPLMQVRVTGEYGSTNRPGGKPHQGMDLRAARGTAVLAPADGRVAVSTDRYDGGARYGKVVVLEHASGTRTLYAHLDGRMVRTGDTVRAGQQIAQSGATGKVTGPHLHFEVSRRGTPVDPHTLLGGALAGSMTVARQP